MDSLARAKAGYDAAVDRERTALIMSVQADAGVRAARQAVTDAVTGWSAEGEALGPGGGAQGSSEKSRRLPARTPPVSTRIAALFHPPSTRHW